MDQYETHKAVERAQQCGKLCVDSENRSIAISRILAGERVVDVANDLGEPYYRVYAWWRKSDNYLDNTRRLKEEKRERLQRLCDSNKEVSLTKLAADMGISRQSLSERMKRLGVKKSPNNRLKFTIEDLRAYIIDNPGLNGRQVARHFGVCHQAVYQRLKADSQAYSLYYGGKK